MRLKLLSALVATSLGAAPALAQELTGTLKKIKETGAITSAIANPRCRFPTTTTGSRSSAMPWTSAPGSSTRVKSELKLDKLDTKLNPVTSATRIPLMANGTIDLECGSTTNNLERQKQVAFTITHFVTANRFVSKKSANLKTVDDLKGKTVVSTSGTTNIKQITEIGAQKGLNLNILAAKDHAEAFLMVETGRAAAFVMDDILLFSLVGGVEVAEGLRHLHRRALGRALRHHAAPRRPPFKKVVDEAMIATYKSGAINPIYEKWFLKPIPPKGINLNVPMSDAFKKVIASPTDSGDPAVY